MSSTTENRLLANLLDALDRLFDRECSPVDLVALLFATSIALDGTRMLALLESTRLQLENLLRSGSSGQELHLAALQATDGLRRELAHQES